MEGLKRPEFLQNHIDNVAPGEAESVAAYAKQKEQELLKSEQEHGSEVEKVSKEQMEKQAEHEKLQKKLKELEDKLEFYKNSFFEKLKNYTEYRQTVDSFSSLGEEATAAKSDLDDITSKLKALEEISFDRTEIDAIEAELKGFQKDLEASWDDAPFDKEDMERDFDTAHLSSLALDDYIKLMKRYPQDMVTHLTRQGLRDHTGMAYHSAGMGEQHNGLKDMLAEKKLHSVMSGLIAEHGKEGAIAEYLDLDSCNTRAEAEAVFNTKIDDEFSDRAAVHFATSEVGDDYYGGEKGNEMFVAYPSVYIASQMHHDGSIAGENSGQRNDVYVWNKDVGGMEIDAGIVFVPKSAQVNPETGSQYKIENGKGVKIEQNVSSLVEVITSDVFASRVEDLLENSRVKAKREINTLAEERERAETAQDIAQNILDEIDGLDDRIKEDLRKVLLAYSSVKELKEQAEYYKTLVQDGADEPAKNYKEHSMSIAVEKALQKQAVMYERTDSSTVSSEEYWNAYFKENPDQKPSKIVYYSGENPTQALNTFLSENGLDKQSESNDERFGFSRTSRKEVDDIEGFEELKGIARNMIDKKFPPSEKTP